MTIPYMSHSSQISPNKISNRELLKLQPKEQVLVKILESPNKPYVRNNLIKVLID